MYRQLTILILLAIIVACGGGGGGSEESSGNGGNTASDGGNPSSGNDQGDPLDFTGPPPDGYGFLVDSPVENIRYVSGEHTGFTDANGRFGYLDGETVIFFVGDIAIGDGVAPAELIMPWELAGGDPKVAMNMARFLQSIDHDGIPDNGIQIHESMHYLAQNREADFSHRAPLVPTVENAKRSIMQLSLKTLIIELTSTTLAGGRAPVDATDAYLHLREVIDASIDDRELEAIAIAGESICLNDSDCQIESLGARSQATCSGFLDIPFSVRDLDWEAFQAQLDQRTDLIDRDREMRDAAFYDPTPNSPCVNDPGLQQNICNIRKHCELVDL